MSWNVGHPMMEVLSELCNGKEGSQHLLARTDSYSMDRDEAAVVAVVLSDDMDHI